MTGVAWIVALVLAIGDAPARGYAGVVEVAAVPGGESPTTTTTSTSTSTTTTTTTTTSTPTPLSRRVVVDTPSGLTGKRLVLQRVGVAAIVVGAAGYVAMIVGLGIGSAAETDLASLRSRSEIDRRRELVARGELGNTLALGAGIAGGVTLVAGIVMIAIARRRGRPPRGLGIRR